MEESKPPEPPESAGGEDVPSPEASAPPPEPPVLEELAPPHSAADSAAPLPDIPEDFEHDVWPALLRNRFILGGLGVLIVLMLTTIVLVVIGSGDGTPRRHSSVGAITTNGEPTTFPRSGPFGLVRTTATMRIGPDDTYAILGTIPRGARVPIVGRNADESWLQVTYPPGTQLHGWVDATFLDITGDVSHLAIAEPGPAPSIPVPTSVYPVQEPTVPPSTGPLATATEPVRQRPTSRPTPLPPPTRTPRETDTPTPTEALPPTPSPPAIPGETPTPAKGGSDQKDGQPTQVAPTATLTEDASGLRAAVGCAISARTCYTGGQ